ncbi:MAG: hypothetical protein KF910_08515 [Brevundimonas sp.]|uniref:hypothetical protein n=1 Tax=Brevundimonas sp. TaxID=1871086 RepID=UPI0025BECA72|nr:hypothetical protein [Brevundimonas sp.]MBX3477637.1 hypothetical protein [Brevundimonas sp.]
MSIVRPTSAQMTRRLAVLAAALFAIIIPQAQLLLGWGQTQAEFAADSDATLRVAGYAFSIWGLIYLGLLVYAVRQALPRTGESDILGRLGWPSVVALLGIGWWIVAAAADWEWATVVLIFGSVAALAGAMLANAETIRLLPRGDADRWMTVLPLSLLAGWLTIAAPLNLITVLTGNGQLPGVLPPTAWALLVGVMVTGMGLFGAWRMRLLSYPLPIAWGLLGAFVAEQERNPALAFPILGLAVLTLVGGLWLSLRLKPGVER